MLPGIAVVAGCLAALMPLVALAAPPSRVVPPEALVLISKVHAAATARNYAALEQLMIREFTWSFGGDNDAPQAIAAWRNDPKYLTQLGRVTALRCAYGQDGYVECPVKAGAGYRAGFKAYADGWRFAYFVAGD